MSKTIVSKKLAIVNEYGNVNLKQTKLSRRYVHVKGKRLQPLCRKLGIRYAEAVVGFERQRRRWRPIKDGVVVSVRSHAKLLAEIKLREERNPPKKREAARKQRERTQKRQEEMRLQRLEEAGINDPESRTANWFERGHISALEAKLIQFKTHYRHTFSNYEEALDRLRQEAEQLSGEDRRDAFECLRQDARAMSSEHSIPSNWKKYLATYDFPYPEIATAIASVLEEPKKAHPVWFCEAVLAVKHSGLEMSELSYPVIRDAISDWRDERFAG